MNTEPKFGYAHDSTTGGESTPLHTLDDYLFHTILLQMDMEGLPANSGVDIERVKALADKLKEDLDDIVDLEGDPSRDTYVQIYCKACDLRQLKVSNDR